MDSLSPVSEGFAGDPWLSIMLTLCQTIYFVSLWLVLDLPINVHMLPACSLAQHKPPHSCCTSIMNIRNTPCSGICFQGFCASKQPWSLENTAQAITEVHLYCCTLIVRALS
jgi:hypothetical protein